MNKIPEKAYKNLNFLNSPAARPIRILCEYEETRQRFAQQRIHHTLVFFGSARTKSSEEAAVMMADAKVAHAANPVGAGVKQQMRKAEIAVNMARYYDEARALSARLTEWSMNREAGRQFIITSGGGPGIMEAANRGASDVKGGRSVGLGISLPFEQGVNEYVTDELAFEFHYFFTRKYWFLYLCKALVVFPGGFGTMDELFETLTLVQTGKVRKDLPVILYGSDYWNKVINVEAMAEFGTISPEDINLMYVADSVEDAFQHLVKRLEGNDPTA